MLMLSYIKLSIFGNIFSGIEKILTTFSISEKIFLKIEGLMYALRAHISKIHKKNWFETPPNINQKDKILEELTSYKGEEGLFGLEMAKRQRKKKAPGICFVSFC